MKPLKALGSGLAGACALTALHETLRRVDPKAPRMDLLGMTALAKILRAIDANPPKGSVLYAATMVGDVVSNALYYSQATVGDKKDIWKRATILGLSAGLGAVALPKPLHLNPAYSNRTTRTKWLTVGLYLAGSLVTAGVFQLLQNKKRKG